MGLFKWAWGILPSFAYIAIGIISFLSGFLQNDFSELELKYRWPFRAGAIIFGIVLFAAGISDFQQRKERVTKSDIGKLPTVDYVGSEFERLKAEIKTKVDKPYKFKKEDFEPSVDFKPMVSAVIQSSGSVAMTIKNNSLRAVENYVMQVSICGGSIVAPNENWERPSVQDPSCDSVIVRKVNVFERGMILTLGHFRYSCDRHPCALNLHMAVKNSEPFVWVLLVKPP